MMEVSSITQREASAQDIREMAKVRPESQEEVKPAGHKNEPVTKSSPAKPNRDEYVQEEKSISGGMYHVAGDEEGKPKIIFDDPEKKTDASEEKDSICRASTDKVDAEIRKLKEKKAQLEKQIAQEKDNPEKVEKLQKELEQVDRELQMKDNDTYRRQHTQFS